MGKSRKNQNKNSFIDIYRKIRKPNPPPCRVIHPKKKYDRRDESWKEEI